MVCWATCHRFVAKHAAAPYQPERLWRPPRVPWEPHRPIQLEQGLWAHPTDPLGWWKPPKGVPGACGGQRGGAPALAAEAPEHPDAHGPPYMGAFLIPNDHTERQGPRGTVPRPALPLESKAKGKEGPHVRRSVRVELPQLWALGRYWPGPWVLWRRSGGRRLNAATGSDAPRVVGEGAVGNPWNVAHVCATWGWTTKARVPRVPTRGCPRPRHYGGPVCSLLSWI